MTAMKKALVAILKDIGNAFNILGIDQYQDHNESTAQQSLTTSMVK